MRQQQQQQQQRQQRRQGKRNSIVAKTKSTVQLILIIVALLDLLDNHRVSSFSSSMVSNSISIYNSHFSLLFAKDNDNDTIEWDADSNYKIQKIGRLASYSDNWLLDFHNWDQSEKQTVTNSLSVWNEEIRDEQKNIVEWQDSFQRNNLADFTPPMSNGLNCLMVGDRGGEGEGDGVNRVKLPWENEPEAKITSLRVLDMEDEDANDDDDDVYLSTTCTSSITDTPIATTARTQREEEMETSTAGEEIIITVECDDKNENDNDILESSNDDNNNDLISQGSLTSAMIAKWGTNGATVRTELIVSNSKITTKAADSTTTSSTTTNNKIRVQDPNKQRAAVYDCIVDQGLMDKVLKLENNHEVVRELLEEAAIAIREYGIYVLVTNGLLTTETRTLLEDCGNKVGMEWEFELDGISNDLEVVSVARRFCAGEMPKVGRLSRYQP
jgi:hypothetical protein